MQFTRRQTLQYLCAAGLASFAPFAYAAPRREDSITVLSFNIFVGGTRRGPLEQSARLIRESGADIVGLQEVKQSGPRLAEMTGLKFTSQGSDSEGVLSRFPVTVTTANKRGVKLDVPKLGPLWLFNVHLAPDPYQPYQLDKVSHGPNHPRIETAVEAIAEALRMRAGQVSRLLMDMGPAMRSGEPIVLTGDFNEPSHLDWTPRAAEAGLCRLPVTWPTSRAITDAGLTDLFRAVHPDEVKRPGRTWTSIDSKNEVHDRIDMIYARGCKPVEAKTIGESADRADLVIDPYPSDHRAVVAKFLLP